MDIFTLVGIVVVVVFSITTHEAAHAWVADLLGDPTARRLGRVTLNPRPHIDLVMTILLPGFLLLSGSPFLFGGAKPVPVLVHQLRRPKRDWALVGAAGPVSNFLMAVLLTALFAALIKLGFWTRESAGGQILVAGVYANILLGLFNLVPIPPLDGSRVIQFFLKGEALRAYQRLERFGLLILVGILFLAPKVFWGILLPLMEFFLSTFAQWFGVEAEVFYALRVLFTQ
jgi:Zn-dependent protease